MPCCASGRAQSITWQHSQVLSTPHPTASPTPPPSVASERALPPQRIHSLPNSSVLFLFLLCTHHLHYCYFKEQVHGDPHAFPVVCVFSLRPQTINITCVSCRRGGQNPLSNYRDGLRETLVSVCVLPCLFFILALESGARACLRPAHSAHPLRQTSTAPLLTLSVK